MLQKRLRRWLSIIYTMIREKCQKTAERHRLHNEGSRLPFEKVLMSFEEIAHSALDILHLALLL